jgi:C-terminal processing protease CtpA/Prc
MPSRNRFSSLAAITLGESREIGDIGYMRLPEMDDELIPEVKKHMEAFRDTIGLIIDVRGNGGGRYGLLRTLFGYFRPADAGPFVCNIAAYRLAPHFPKDHIEYRPTYRREWDGWSAQDLAAIDAAMAKFKPSFHLAEGKFSPWHFMVLKQEKFQYHYDKPVIVLSDESCFSATDGFLAAFAELPKITLMGVSSRGGSGSSRTVLLTRSRIAFKLSTMASFRPNGDTFDGKGIAVDVEARPAPEDYITGKDSVLDQALKRLSPPR